MFDIALGILSATGGFVDLGQIIFLGQSGAKFFYTLIWTVILGTVIVVVYGEMAGRVAAVAKLSVFDLVRERLPRWAGYIATFSSLITTLITCAAEIGGMGLVLGLAFGWPYPISVIVSAAVLGVVIWLLPFEWIENGFGLLGLGMLIFLVATFFLHPDWIGIAKGIVPQLPPQRSTPQLLLYAYFVVGMISAVLMPYELVFYSAGAIEQKWSVKKIAINKLVTIGGFVFGAVAALAILVNAVVLFDMYKIDPQLLGSTILQAVVPFGFWGMVIALFGVFFAISGAAVETCLSVAYTICQFWKYPWSKSKSFREVPVFYYAWVATLVISMLIALFGPSPIETAEYAVIFSVLAMPLSFLVILLGASDKKMMGKYANGTTMNLLGWISFAVIVIVAVAAVPLLIVTSLGSIA